MRFNRCIHEEMECMAACVRASGKQNPAHCFLRTSLMIKTMLDGFHCNFIMVH